MSSSSSRPPRHFIGILMSANGRFLMCRDCSLTFEFVAGERFDAIAQKFDSFLCAGPSETDNPLANTDDTD